MSDEIPCAGPVAQAPVLGKPAKAHDDYRMEPEPEKPRAERLAAMMDATVEAFGAMDKALGAVEEVMLDLIEEIDQCAVLEIEEPSKEKT